MKVKCNCTNCLHNNATSAFKYGDCTKQEVTFQVQDIELENGKEIENTNCVNYEYADKGEDFRAGIEK